jgi:tRNA dimethylallyltransferase
MTSTIPNNIDTLILLGATATGKTHLGVQLAHELGGEIISADSRQVYRGLDIGSGKDLDEYSIDDDPIPYHLIDCSDLSEEYNVFEFQRRAFEAHGEITQRGYVPIIVGGTGLYMNSLLQDHLMPDVPKNAILRNELSSMSHENLVAHLAKLKGELHNTTDTLDPERLIRAIEIEEFTQDNPPQPTPKIHPFIIGIQVPRSILHERITLRLKERMNNGMIEEVEGLLANGATPERLSALGLEYRFVTELLTGNIKNKNDLFQKLLPAIKNFAKRQETWFRRMEKKGVKIHWIDKPDLIDTLNLIRQHSDY